MSEFNASDAQLGRKGLLSVIRIHRRSVDEERRMPPAKTTLTLNSEVQRIELLSGHCVEA